MALGAADAVGFDHQAELTVLAVPVGVVADVALDVLDKTATAKLTADWGVDYFHLARFDGQWQIVNVMWQSPPMP